MPKATNVGVQSWSFRHFNTIDTLLPQVKAIGLDRIEICGVHVNFEDAADHARVISACRAAGVTIGSMGVQTFTGNIDKEKLWFDFAKAAGVKVITAQFQIGNFHRTVPIAAALAEAYDVKIAIHCHGGYIFGGSADVISHLLELGGPRIGLCIDTAWALQAAADPVEWTKRFAGRIYGAHYKDFVFDAKGKWKEVIPGQGALDLPGFVQGLDASGFDGMAVVEYEAESENPGPSIAKGVAAVKAVAKQAVG